MDQLGKRKVVGGGGEGELTLGRAPSIQSHSHLYIKQR
jgi:hypothetical protein